MLETPVEGARTQGVIRDPKPLVINTVNVVVGRFEQTIRDARQRWEETGDLAAFQGEPERQMLEDLSDYYVVQNGIRQATGGREYLIVEDTGTFRVPLSPDGQLWQTERVPVEGLLKFLRRESAGYVRSRGDKEARHGLFESVLRRNEDEHGLLTRNSRPYKELHLASSLYARIGAEAHLVFLDPLRRGSNNDSNYFKAGAIIAARRELTLPHEIFPR